jgi:hypothetical protein
VSRDNDYFGDSNHALLMGELLGSLMKEDRWMIETHAEPEIVDGNFTNRIFLKRRSGIYVLTLEKAG